MVDDTGIFRPTLGVAALSDASLVAEVEGVLVDTGSEYTWLPETLLASLGIVPVRVDRFETADGRILERSVGFAMIRAGGTRTRRSRVAVQPEEFPNGTPPRHLWSMSRRRQNRRPAPTTDKRSPEVRLEAMVREDNVDRALRMLGRIRNDLNADPNPAPWLAAARAIWERLIISEDAWFYLAELFTECLVYGPSSCDSELDRLHDEMVAIERQHGLGEDDYWRISEAPAEWQTVEAAWERRAAHIVDAYLRDAGHADVADFREEHLAEFRDRGDKGREELWGPSSEWDDDEYILN